ncbi:hypothetical protein [Thermodesulfatator atlanticus]|uniref:hypothetical protein n=1 Tax=Thermodesulfatator atlanticus TaxID=501497 RepID=UPI0003FFFEE3|nr:hypothetical protein [Thermodesulfatator atlanticus]
MEKLLDKQHPFNWDRCDDPELLLIREMLYGDPVSILKKHPKEELKKIFLKNIHLFRRKNRSFWKLALGVSDEEIAQATEKSFRETLSIWPH